MTRPVYNVLNSTTLVSPVALKPYERNARTHSKRQIKQIAASIEKFGFTNPVLVDDDSCILAGHGRVLAAKLLGLQEIPVLRLSNMSEADKRAYVIADNRLAEKAGWDRQILAIELQALVDLDFEVELTGFEMAEIDLILGEVDEAKDPPALPEDDIPAVSSGKAISKKGDLWILGPHHLFCADSREAPSYDRLMEGALGSMFRSTRPHGARHVGFRKAGHDLGFDPRARMGRDAVAAVTLALPMTFRSTRPHGARRHTLRRR